MNLVNINDIIECNFFIHHRRFWAKFHMIIIFMSTNKIYLIFSILTFQIINCKFLILFSFIFFLIQPIEFFWLITENYM